ncbi:MAG TPA: hypothetical protein VMW42_01880 [Desulfatiglandales bacterium]|nr:hypothetical protein [Desulfatiglandales bacterium]
MDKDLKDIEKAMEELRKEGRALGKSDKDIDKDVRVIRESISKIEEFRIEGEKIGRAYARRAAIRFIGEFLVLCLNIAIIYFAVQGNIKSGPALLMVIGCSALMFLSHSIEKQEKREAVEKMDKIFKKLS